MYRCKGTEAQFADKLLALKSVVTVHLFIVGKNIFRIAAKKKKKKKASTVFCQFVTQYNIKQTSDEDKEKNFN